MLQWTFVILMLAVCAFVLISLGGCMTAEKATAYLKKKDKLDDACAENYPVKDSIIKGDTVVTTDTLTEFEIYIDTTVVKDTVYITRMMPSKIITKTIRLTDTVIRRDNARENVLQDQVRDCTDLQLQLIAKNTALEEKVSDMTAKRNKWRLWFWILVGAIGTLTVLRLKKIISI